MLQSFKVQGFRILSTALVAFTFSCEVMAWGKIGHEAIALLAEEGLSATAKIKIKEILGSEDMLAASLWPDKMRYTPAWKHTKGYHFTQVPDGATYFSALEDSNSEELNKADALRALIKAEDMLRDPATNPQSRNYALKFLLHVLGDIHQPLHTGRPEDLGGNTIKMNWYEKESNVHSVIDSGVIAVKIEIPFLAPPEDSETGSEEARYYISILKRPQPKDVAKWILGSYLTWHNESMKLRSEAYQASVLSNDKFVKQFTNAIDQRILMAGYRLANVLNNILDNPRTISRESTELRLALTKTLGHGHDRHVSFEPKEREKDLPYYISPLDLFECHHDH
jgi:hypothetical protein